MVDDKASATEDGAVSCVEAGTVLSVADEEDPFEDEDAISAVCAAVER